ncbi:hypothetical protein AXG93_4170s1240 [Marchantia polymorpha subsp. ruderalis]|uniref:Uncharacterized protein n=1 Tax=Marchantia polymorpha subsp. ruderalis TaxID=1480154 RepID=A0A176VMN2_MARPO|nr:hypothetical protein AXG93_4170s1240 [Marchantia polymorpha subsp. ruderalis]
MKARRLILEADNSTESGAALSRGRPIREGRAEANTRREKEASAKMGSWTSEVRSTPVAQSQFTRKEKGKAVMTVEVPPRQDEVSLASIMMKTPLKRTAEVFSLLQYLDRKREKYAKATTNGSYLELVHNRTRTKVIAASVDAVKERQNQSTEAEYQVLRKRLAKEVEKQRLEACWTAYNVESLRLDELTAASQKKEQEYETKLAIKAKKLAECEAAWISDLELIEKLETQCS